jgi:hypothetical protein
MEVAKNFDETFNKLIKFLESENFQTIVGTVAEIVFYYIMLIPQISGGTLLGVASVGANGDIISDGLGLITDCLFMGVKFVEIIANTAGFVIELSGSKVNLIDEFSSLTMDKGINGLEKDLKMILTRFDKDGNFKNQVKSIINAIMGFIEAGATIVSDIISIVAPDDAGLLKGIIGTLINTLKVSLLAARAIPITVFETIKHIYNSLPYELRELFENPVKLSNFLNDCINTVINVLSKIQFIGEPQQGGFNMKEIENITKKFHQKMSSNIHDGLARVNNALKIPKIKPPSLEEINIDTTKIIKANTNIKNELGKIVFPAPVVLKTTSLDALFLMKSTIPAATEITYKIFPLTMSLIYLVEYSMKL